MCIRDSHPSTSWQSIYLTENQKHTNPGIFIIEIYLHRRVWEGTFYIFCKKCLCSIFSMFDYTQFSPEDFTADGFFRRWKLGKDPEATLFWTEWVAQHPQKLNDIEKATLLLEAVAESFDQITEFEIRTELQRIAARLNQDSGRHNTCLLYTSRCV